MKIRFKWLYYVLGLMLVIVQSWLWSGPFTDDGVWESRVAQLQSDLASGFVQGDNPVYSGHPGGPILLVGAGVMGLGAPPEVAVRVATVFLVVALAVAVCLVAVRLRAPVGWVGIAGGVAAVSATYGHSSPTNAVAGVGLMALIAGTIYLYERRITGGWLLVWAGLWGFLLAVRLPAAAIIGGPLWLLLGFRMRRWWLLMGATAAVSAFVFNPLAWFTPISHLQYILWRSSLNFTPAVADIPLTMTDFLLHAPLAVLGVVATVAGLWLRPTKTIWRAEVWWVLLLASASYLVVFLEVRAQSLRHFQPLLMWWEAVAGLWALYWLKQSRWGGNMVGAGLIVVLIVGMNLWLLIGAI